MMAVFLTYMKSKSFHYNFHSYRNEELHPDENYAREIMQLFTIGLYDLNLDGTRKVDSNGENIPTYTNEDIVAFGLKLMGEEMVLEMILSFRPKKPKTKLIATPLKVAEVTTGRKREW